jgi:formylglycine-generating enzyme required for sulfatase activity
LHYRFAGGQGVVDQGVGLLPQGPSVPVRPSATTTYTLRVTAGDGRSVTSGATVTVKPGIDLVLEGLGNATARVEVQGPGGFSRSLAASTALPGLTPGLYRIQAHPIPQEGGTLQPLRPVQEVQVASGTQVTVTYAAPALALQLPGGVPLEFVEIPAGRFTMGSERIPAVPGEPRAVPERLVALANPFYLGRFLVTHGQWQAVTGEAPAPGQAPDQPKTSLSYLDIHDRFLPRLNQLLPGYLFRLPSEAEWEYACRAGTRHPHFFPATPQGYEQELAHYAWRDGQPHPVGGKWANPWGLFDLFGLGFQWCEDNASERYPAEVGDGSAQVDPTTSRRILRGLGAGPLTGHACQRYAREPDQRTEATLLRLVATRK